jgi:hypothetical protein
LIFALPLPLLWSLEKTTKRDKWAVLASFAVGFVSTLVAGVRLYSIRVYTLSPEPVREAALINLWSFIEVNFGILCTSGPGKIPEILMSKSKVHGLTCVTVIKALFVPSRKKPVIDGLEFGSTKSRPSDVEMAKKHQSITIDEEDSMSSRDTGHDV